MNIIGREKEIEELKSLYNKDSSELVAIYGRRRVGKTYLVNQVFDNVYSFKHAGMSPLECENGKSNAKEQLNHFYNSLKLYGMKENKKPKNWLDAFYMLEVLLSSKKDGKKQVVFIDELPWMDTPKSNFISAFEAFWNTWANGRNIMVIVCGSANSWIINNLINNYGGLYGRVTYEIKLEPLCLRECELLLKRNNVLLSRYDIVQAYMAVGGIPYYLNYFQPKLTLNENINLLFFKNNSVLKDEFSRLFKSIFTSPGIIEKIVRFLAKKHIGLTKEELCEELKMAKGESVDKALKGLLASNFIIKYKPLTDEKKMYYKLIDPFCIFYLKFVDNTTSLDIDLFSGFTSKQSIVSYRKIAFENVCFNHINQIKNALRILGVESTQSTFIYKGDGNIEEAQIDLLIKRRDNIVNMCEIKYYVDEYTNDKTGHLSIVRKNNTLSNFIKKRQTIRNVLITTYGLKYNEYSGDYVNTIVLDDLFKEL